MADDFIADLDPAGAEGMIVITVDRAAATYVVTYGTSIHSFAIKGALATAGVVIESLLPNPVGGDSDLEEVTLRNDGATTVDLAGWLFRDLAGNEWDLAGDIMAGGTITVVRNGAAMSLNNGGDEIPLVTLAGDVEDLFTYAASSEGVRIDTGH